MINLGENCQVVDEENSTHRPNPGKAEFIKKKKKITHKLET